MTSYNPEFAHEMSLAEEIMYDDRKVLGVWRSEHRRDCRAQQLGLGGPKRRYSPP